jgi:N-acetylneuraminate synthase
VSDASEPYVIAEIGVNHEGSVETALELIRLAAEGGADGAKFQTYKAAKLASRHSPSYWNLAQEPTTSQFELFRKYDRFDPADYRTLAARCSREGIDFLSTPFDLEAVDLLDPLVPFFKIASADITNVPLLRKVAGTFKPVVLSTGASTLEEISDAVALLEGAGAPAVVLLHCVLNYPTPYEAANLNMIGGLRLKFPDRVIGYSDHTLPDPQMGVLAAAYLKGARVIEKHFTHDKSLPGNDHYHAMDISDLKTLRRQIRFVRSLEGQTAKAPLESEMISRQNARRSIVLARPVQNGAILDEAALTCKRPGSGISPLDWHRVVGMRAARDLAEDTILTWDDLS